MINIKKFEFKKSYEEVELAGEIYKIELNDERLLVYMKAFDKFYTKSNELHEIETEKLDIKTQEEVLNEMAEMIEEILDLLLGQGAYDELYKKSGQSVINMVDVVLFVGDVVGERMEQSREEKKQQYVKKKI